ncbi:MAG: GNAT family N-acetyltransferase [Alphaproteobacteria bacterium]|nr:GNAT family N-acetyltransferase [Alphaproteobacteria bacterium]
MSEQPQMITPVLRVEQLEKLTPADLNDLCDATDAAVESGGGFGWVALPARELLERYWQGVVTMPARLLYVARLDGVICGTAQVVLPPMNNEAQKHAVHLTGVFVAPWARGYGLSRLLLELVEERVAQAGYSVINLDVRETMTAAVHLFESLGYERIGEHPYYAKVDDRIIKGYYYTKWLEAPPARPISVS